MNSGVVEQIEIAAEHGQLRGKAAGVLRGLVHRGGLRADVLDGGVITPGDAVAPV